ncbi:MAG: hypothetical protein ABI693_10585 [Bryobacteraceae bacterium]
MRVTAIGVCSIFALWVNAAGTAADPKAKLVETLNALKMEAGSMRGRQRGIHLQLDSIDKSLAYFKNRVGSWQPTGPGEAQALQEGLEADLKALRSFSTDRTRTVQMAEAVAEDLSIKVEHCQKTGLAAMITARVRTFRDGKEVTGLEVFYMPKIRELFQNAEPDRFPALSAAEQRLAAGRYVFWAGNGVPKRATVVLGMGASQTPIDLVVP